jgi:hypothetical protein
MTLLGIVDANHYGQFCSQEEAKYESLEHL